MTLLALLGRDRDPARDPEVVAAHFDHGTRGPDSAEDGRFVAEVARRWGVRTELGRGRAPERSRSTGEAPLAAARVLRYRFLVRAARAVDAAAIVTAHHRDDRVETVLLRLVRGTSPDGLGALLPIESLRGALVLRPLLPFSRRAIAGWAEATGVPFRDDPSNRDARHPRTRVRSEIVPLLAELNPRVDEALVRLSSLAAADAAYLGERRDELLEAAGLEQAEQARGTWRAEAAMLAAAPSVLLSRALLHGWAAAADPGVAPPGAEWVAGAMRFVRGGRGGEIPGPGGVRLCRRGRWLEFRGGRRRDDEQDG